MWLIRFCLLFWGVGVSGKRRGKEGRDREDGPRGWINFREMRGLVWFGMYRVWSTFPVTVTDRWLVVVVDVVVCVYVSMYVFRYV